MEQRTSRDRSTSAVLPCAPHSSLTWPEIRSAVALGLASVAVGEAGPLPVLVGYVVIAGDISLGHSFGILICHPAARDPW